MCLFVFITIIDYYLGFRSILLRDVWRFVVSFCDCCGNNNSCPRLVGSLHVFVWRCFCEWEWECAWVIVVCFCLSWTGCSWWLADGLVCFWFVFVLFCFVYVVFNARRKLITSLALENFPRYGVLGLKLASLCCFVCLLVVVASACFRSVW